MLFTPPPPRKKSKTKQKQTKKLRALFIYNTSGILCLLKLRHLVNFTAIFKIVQGVTVHLSMVKWFKSDQTEKREADETPNVSRSDSFFTNYQKTIGSFSKYPGTSELGVNLTVKARQTSKRWAYIKSVDFHVVCCRPKLLIFLEA